jgi:tRNA pseudouridine55 synthase
VIRTATDGLLVIDKPRGITSRDAVNRAQQWFPRRTRIGHSGTLDPLATGVLVLCVGNATRLAEYVQRMPKTYRAGIVLAGRSDTDDADGKITPTAGVTPPTLLEVRAHLDSFLGEIEQVPPAFSAAKVTGRRAYDLARRGKDVDLAARRVTIHGIDILGYQFPLLQIEVRCGKGTYIRSLARDLGKRIGCGGYVQELQRTRVGCFDLSMAVSLDVSGDTAQHALQPLALAVSDLPRLTLSPENAARMRHGQPLPLVSFDRLPVGEVALFDESAGDLLAVAIVDEAHGCIRPGKVLMSVPAH